MRALVLLVFFVVVAGCSDAGSGSGTDASPATGQDALPDGSGDDAAPDVAMDAAPGADVAADVQAPDSEGQAPDTGGPVEDAGGPVADAGTTGPGPDPTNACNGGCGTGAITGLVCAPNEQVFVNGAIVSVDATGCDGQPVHIEVTSDAKGRYTLEGVPCGYQTVHVKKGSFEHSFKVPVEVGDTSDVTAAGTKQCFKATGVRIAVITGDWDEIGGLIGKLGFSYDSYDLYGGGWDGQDWSSGDAIDLLLDPGALAQYDVLFINCGAAHDELVSVSSTAVSNLRQWVEAGGSLYVSDFAFVYAEQAWPWAVDFMGDDSKGSMYDSGGPIQMSGNQGVPGHVLDAALASYLGTWYIAVQYDLGPLVALSADAQALDTIVHVDAYVEQFGQTLPLVVSFVPKPGAGRVVVTTFHNDAQATEQMLVTLSYLVFTL